MSETSTADWSYRPGPWFAVFGPQVTVLLPESERDRVIGIWALVDGGGGFDDVLDGLLASGLSRLPGFVLLGASDGPTRVLLRGSGVTATLATDDDEVVVDGSASATWVERSVDGVTALRIEIASDGGVADRDFPVATGLVRVGRVDRPAHLATSAAAPSVTDRGTVEDGTPAAGPLAGAIAAPVAVTGMDVPEGLNGHDGPDVPEGSDEGPATELLMPVDGDPLTDPFPMSGAEPESEAEPETESEVEPDGEPEPAEMETAEPATGEPTTHPEAPESEAPAGWVTPWDAPAPVDADTLPPTEPFVVEPAAEDSAVGDPAAEDPAAEEPAPEEPVAGVPAFPPPSAEPVTEVAPPSYLPPPPDQPPVDAPPPPPLGIGSWEPVGGFPPPPPAPASPTGDTGDTSDTDHDGLTVAGRDVDAPPLPGIPGQPQAPAVTPPVAALKISDGQTIVVDRVVLIGRAPEARRFTSTEQPLLVTVPSRLHEISSTHVEVRPGTGADHGTAVVTDMGSTNGTVLVQPGLGPEDLKPGIAVQLIPGAIINLGDGITIQVTRP